MERFNNLKIALVHDFLIYPGGAEKVLEVLSEMFPEAPIYTLLYDKEKMSAQGGPAYGWRDREIRTSFLQKFPRFLRNHHQWLLPFYPVAVETFDLREFDLVVSSSGAWSKGIVTKLNIIHIAYIHSPARFLWENSDGYIKENKKRKPGFFIRLLLSYLRVWDFEAAQRPDFLIANSKFTAERIEKYYRRKSHIIYPPIITCHSERSEESLPNSKINDSSSGPFASAQGDKKKIFKNFFLVVSRLSPYKKIDKVVEAFNKLGLPLIIIGEGKQEKYLRSIARSNIQILGWQSDKKVAEYYAKSRALIFSGVDDFGIAPVEAMSFGVPVIALRDGGAKETVIEGKTGEFFNSATPEVIADGVRRFMENEGNYDKEFIIEQAKNFSKDVFIKKIKEYIEGKVDNLQ